MFKRAQMEFFKHVDFFFVMYSTKITAWVLDFAWVPCLKAQAWTSNATAQIFKLMQTYAIIEVHAYSSSHLSLVWYNCFG